MGRDGVRRHKGEREQLWKLYYIIVNLQIQILLNLSLLDQKVQVVELIEIKLKHCKNK